MRGLSTVFYQASTYEERAEAQINIDRVLMPARRTPITAHYAALIRTNARPTRSAWAAPPVWLILLCYKTKER